MPDFIVTQTMAEYKENKALANQKAWGSLTKLLWLFIPATAFICVLFYQAVNL